MSSLDNPTLGLHHEALGDDLRPQGLLSVLPSARAAVAGVTHDFYADAVGVFDGNSALAAIGAIGVELLQSGDFDAGLRHDFSGGVAVLHAGRTVTASSRPKVSTTR